MPAAIEFGSVLGLDAKDNWEDTPPGANRMLLAVGVWQEWTLQRKQDIIFL